MTICLTRFQQLTAQRAYEVRIGTLGVEAVLEPYRLPRRPRPAPLGVIPAQTRREAGRLASA